MTKHIPGPKVVVVGGGAAGFFAALTAKETHPEAQVIILEQSAKLLSKVRISGGGRCNVTHACFDPKRLVQNYPRGHKELLGPFHRFQPKDTIAWFEARGVQLKAEEDGRMFPITDSSETIIDCFLKEAKRLGVEIHLRTKLDAVQKTEGGFEMADRLILATGSAPAGYALARSLGHTIQPPVPSLFTLNIPAFPLAELSGISLPIARIKLKGSSLEQTGPLLITHFGLSGPAALKLSAFAARLLADLHYEATLEIDWLPATSLEHLTEWIAHEKKEHPTRQIGNVIPPDLPKSLWRALCGRALLSPDLSLSNLKKSDTISLLNLLKHDDYQMKGKTTHKEEFVTCGGVTLSEVDFRTMESKICPGLYFCGELLDIDGVTGGFNFQNAWTTGWIAGKMRI